MADGVTTAIVLFVFVCVLFPRLIDNRAQYYVGFLGALLIILMDALGLIFATSGTARVFFAVAVALLQIASIVMLFMAAGGLTARGLTREMASAFEVIRRGESEREIIIPIGEQKEKPERKRAIDTAGEPPQRFDLTSETGGAAGYPSRAPGAASPSAASPSTPPRRDGNPADGPIPMD